MLQKQSRDMSSIMRHGCDMGWASKGRLLTKMTKCGSDGMSSNYKNDLVESAASGASI